MKVLRSTLFVAATAIIAAACGDKVNVQGPTSAVAKINSVQVAPASATISVGQSVTLTAAINADAGVTTTTAWTSSSAAASVTQAGVVLGVSASPGVAICATVTAGTQSVQNCATVVVQPVAAVVPATVQITSVTGANLNTPVAVPPGVVAGQINVSVTANPGTARLDSVVVYINGIAAGTQTLTSAQAAALRSAANEAAANQQVVAPIVFSINTAAYSTTTGAVSFLNGPMVISAVAYGHQGTSASSNSASQSLSYILGNVDGFQTSVSVTANSGTGTAIDPTGFAWMGNGTLKISAIPVMYSGKTLGSVTGSLGAGTAPCVAGVGAAVTTTTATAGVWVVSLPLAALQSPAGCTTTTPNMPVLAATDAAGNVITLVANGTINTQAGVRWDNVAPPTAGLIAALAVNGRTNNWINDAVSLNTVTAAGNLNGAIAAAVVDAGVAGAISYNVRVAATYATAKTAAAVANSAGLAMTSSNLGYCAIAFTADLLGNTQTAPAGTCAAPANGAVGPNSYVLPVAGVASLTFGVDRVAPLVSYDATSLAANARQSGANIAGEFVFTVSDTGVVGNSGMAPTTPITAQITRVISAGSNGPGTSSARNADLTAATTAGVQVGTGMVAALPLIHSTITASTQAGYYTIAATAFDAAGNSTVAAARTILYDAPAPTVGATSTPLSVAALGWSATAFINDALDIQTQWFSGDYATLPAPFAAAPSATPPRFAQAQTQLNGFNPAASFNNTNYAISQAINLPFQLQTGQTVTLVPISGVEANAINQGNLTTTGATAAAPAYTGAALTAISITGQTTWGPVTNSIASNNISSGVTTAATVGNPASGTLSVTATGNTATYNNPFTSVVFYAVNNGGAAGTEWRVIGTAPLASLVDNGGVRTLTWTLPISGATLYSTLSFTATATTNIIAVGYNAAGTVGEYTVVPYVLNIIK